MQPEINGTKQFPPFFYPKVEFVLCKTVILKFFSFLKSKDWRLVNVDKGSKEGKAESVVRSRKSTW